MKTLRTIVVGSMLLGGSLDHALNAQDTTRTDTTKYIKKSVTEETIEMKSTTPETKEVPVVVSPPPSTEYVAPQEPPKETEHQVGFHFALRFQPAFSSLSSRTYERDGILISGDVGYGYGIALTYFYNNHFSNQVEVMYSSLSQKYTDKYNVHRTVDLAYINIPFLLGLHSDYGKAVSVNVMAGPQLGVLTGTRLEEQSHEGTGHVEAVLAAKPFDLGVAYGAGLDFGLGKNRHTHINIGFRGARGIINIDNSTDGANTTTERYYILERAHTNLYGIYAGLMFKL